MADITACHGGHCPVKELCYRFYCNKNPYAQSYFSEIPFTYIHGIFKCDEICGKEAEDMANRLNKKKDHVNGIDKDFLNDIE